MPLRPPEIFLSSQIVRARLEYNGIFHCTKIMIWTLAYLACALFHRDYESLQQVSSGMGTVNAKNRNTRDLFQKC